MATVFPSGVEVGVPGAAGFSMIFTDELAVFAYLPQLAIEGVLTSDQLDPTTSSSGSFGGDVLALALNIGLSDAGVLGGTVERAVRRPRSCAGSPIRRP